jgi:hypothetical protein
VTIRNAAQSRAAKAKGRSAEQAVCDYLNANLGTRSIERRRLAGVEDCGDIAGLEGWCIEVKNAVRTDLAGWMDELENELASAHHRFGAKHGLVWHKKRGESSPGQWYCTMPGWLALVLIERTP